MTVEQPRKTARIDLVNAHDSLAIDLQATAGRETLNVDVGPLELGGPIEADGGADRPFGTYRLEVREKDATDGPVLAAAEVGLSAGACYSAVFHHDEAGGHALSLYAEDFRAGADPRLEIRHVGAAARIEWTLAPKDGADPRLPATSRSGSLTRRQWQQTRELPPNDYHLEVAVAGRLVAERDDLTLEREKALVVYYAGPPEPQAAPADGLRADLLAQDYRVASGAAGAATTTRPKPPVNGAAPVDPDAPVSAGGIVFDCPPVETYAGAPVEAPVGAHDPEGAVTAFEVLALTPGDGMVVVVEGSVTPAAAPGEPARALLSIGADLMPGEHTVRLQATSAGGAAGTCALPVSVRPVTVERLCARIAGFRALGEIPPKAARELERSLTGAAEQFARGDVAAGRDTLDGFVWRLEAGKAGPVAGTAAAALVREAKTLRASLESA